MAQIKIFGLQSALSARREPISLAIHQAIVEVLAYPPEKKFHRFVGLTALDFVYPSDRSENYTIIEISMFEGRSKETKRALIQKLFENIEKSAGIAAHDIEITIFETPKGNWGIRGQCADELTLGYKVEV